MSGVKSALSAWESFWFDRSMEPGRLAALRVALFGLLGLDLLHLMVRHAWRYGVAGFNMAHFPFIDTLLPAPRADLQVAIYLICGFLSLRIAAGIAVRGSLYALTALYSFGYFNSQLDGYQHHYLICWLLLIACAVSFHEAPGVDRGAERKSGERIRSWGLSLLYAQISIVYLFTAVTKVTPYWLNGWALQKQISTEWLRELMVSVELALSLTPGDIYALTAAGICVWQFTVAASFLVPRLRPFACLSGPLFHAMVEVIGLEVEWFSFYMIALYYLLLFPDTWFAATSRWLKRVAAPLGGVWAALTAPVEPSRAVGVALTALTAVICGALGFSGALPGGAYVGGALTLAVALSWRAGPTARARLPLQVLFACLVWAVPRYTGSAYDFYRFQGGGFMARGELEAAVDAYYEAVEYGPDVGSRRVKLAGLLHRLDRSEEALEVYREAHRLDPDDDRAASGIRTLEALNAED